MSNLVSLLVSTLVVFLIPKLIGVEDYGYWQLFLFYASYVGFLHFGWNDGISLSKNVFLELAVTFIFIVTGWFLSLWVAGVIYLVAYGMYIFVKKKDIANTMGSLRALMQE